MAILAIKSGTTEIAGSTIKGSFCYFSANTTTDLGPTSVTGFYSGIDAPNNGYTVYQIGGIGGWVARVATDTTELNSILISAGATGSTVDQRITWATNTDSVFINSGTTVAPGNIYTFILNNTGTPPLSGQLNGNTFSQFIYLPKTDFNGGTPPTPQVGDLVTYTNGSGGGWVNAVIDFVNDEGTWWYLYSYDFLWQPGMTNGVNYNLVITQPPTYTIGQAALGGIIAYINGGGSTGTSGLVATVADISTGAEWGCNGTPISGADGTAIGTGNQNTIDIMAGCATAGIAARLCGDLVEGGFSDWYLPSKDELNALYTNKVAIGGFTNNPYWTSTEVTGNSAWFQNFNNGFQLDIGKGSSFRVRAIRSF